LKYIILFVFLLFTTRVYAPECIDIRARALLKTGCPLNVARWIIKYTDELGISEHAHILATMFKKESRFDSCLLGKDGEIGLVQFMPIYERREFRCELNKRNIKIKREYWCPEYQVAIGCAAFERKLKEARNVKALNIRWEAVRRYNGSGKDSYIYMFHVKQLVSEIFGGRYV